MKKIHIKLDGTLQLQDDLRSLPPLGFTIPPGHAVQVTIPTARTLGTLGTCLDGAIADNVEARINGNVYAYNSGDWYETVNFTQANDTTLAQGLDVALKNPTGRDVSIQW